MEVDEIIEQTVDATIVKMKMAGLLRDSRKTAYQKTEELLYNYKTLKNIDSPKAVKIIKRIESAIKDLQDEPHIGIIKLYYFNGYTREAVAEELGVSVRTVARNKAKLVNKLKLKLFTDDVIYELFL